MSRLPNDLSKELAKLTERYSKGEITSDFYREVVTYILDQASQYNCKSFNSDMKSIGQEVSFGNQNVGLASHVGRDIGGDMYGHRYILSKQGASFPITVNTSRQLTTGAWYLSNPAPYNVLPPGSAGGQFYGRPYYAY